MELDGFMRELEGFMMELEGFMRELKLLDFGHFHFSERLNNVLVWCRCYLKVITLMFDMVLP